MQHRSVLILLFLVTVLSDGTADDYSPRSVAASDFAGLIDHSPFNRTLNVSGSLVLTGIAEIDNQRVATILDTENKETYVVSTTPNKQGWKMLDYQANQDLERVTAKISVAGEVVNIRYAEVKLKPGETRPAGGSARTEISSDSKGQRRGPPEDVRKKMSTLSDDQRGKFINKMRDLREKKPDMSSDDRAEAARKLIDKISKSKGN